MAALYAYRHGLSVSLDEIHRKYQHNPQALESLANIIARINFWNPSPESDDKKRNAYNSFMKRFRDYPISFEDFGEPEGYMLADLVMRQYFSGGRRRKHRRGTRKHRRGNKSRKHRR